VVTAYRVYTVDAEGCRTLNVCSLLAEHALCGVRAMAETPSFSCRQLWEPFTVQAARLPRSVVPSPVSRGSVSPKLDAGAAVKAAAAE
jgi:hypothetical protein